MSFFENTTIAGHYYSWKYRYDVQYVVNKHTMCNLSIAEWFVPGNILP
jgi:hypothetical protein